MAIFVQYFSRNQRKKLGVHNKVGLNKVFYGNGYCFICSVDHCEWVRIEVNLKSDKRWLTFSYNGENVGPKGKDSEFTIQLPAGKTWFPAVSFYKGTCTARFPKQ